jgi:hypothetical protein
MQNFLQIRSLFKLKDVMCQQLCVKGTANCSKRTLFLWATDIWTLISYQTQLRESNIVGQHCIAASSNAHRCYVAFKG